MKKNWMAIYVSVALCCMAGSISACGSASDNSASGNNTAGSSTSIVSETAESASESTASVAEEPGSSAAASITDSSGMGNNSTDAVSEDKEAVISENDNPKETSDAEISPEEAPENSSQAQILNQEEADGQDSAEPGTTKSPSSETIDPAIEERNQTIHFTIDGTTIYLDETLNELANTGLAFTRHDNASGSDEPVDETYCAQPFNNETITLTVTDSSGNPVSVSLWNKWLDSEPDTLGELTVMNIGIAEPAPVSWSQASLGPYGIYIGMTQSDLIAAAGEPESHVQFVKSPAWLYSGDNYTMTINVSGGLVKGIWVEDAVKESHSN